MQLVSRQLGRCKKTTGCSNTWRCRCHLSGLLSHYPVATQVGGTHSILTEAASGSSSPMSGYNMQFTKNITRNAKRETTIVLLLMTSVCLGSASNDAPLIKKKQQHSDSGQAQPRMKHSWASELQEINALYA